MAAEHRKGCATSRGRTCTCPTLEQWDAQAAGLKGPGTLVIPDGLAGVRHDMLMPGGPLIVTQSEWERDQRVAAANAARIITLSDYDGLFKEPGNLITKDGLHWRAKYYEMRRHGGFVALLGAAGWALAVARGIWGF